MIICLKIYFEYNNKVLRFLKIEIINIKIINIEVLEKRQ